MTVLGDARAHRPGILPVLLGVAPADRVSWPWVALTSGVADAALAYLGYLQVDNSVVAYNRAASNLASVADGWQVRSPHQRGARAFGELVTSVENVLSQERAGWAHFMSEAMHDLQARQQAAADKVNAESAPVPAADPDYEAPP